MGVLNIPNTITITRVLIIPIFVTSIIYKRYDYSFLLFVTAAITDMLDGLFARLTNQKTVLGTFLDPLADKFLLVTSFIVLSYYRWIPGWLTIIVISRDIIVIAGWFILYLISGISKVEPSVLGKITIWIQSLFIAYVLLNINLSLSKELPRILLWATSIVTIFSGLHYIYKGLKIAHEED